MARRQVKDIAYDGITFWPRRQREPRAPSRKAHESGTPEEGRSQREVWVVVHRVENRREGFHQYLSEGGKRGGLKGEAGKGQWSGQEGLFKCF